MRKITITFSVEFTQTGTGIHFPEDEIESLSPKEQKQLWAALWLVSNLKAGFMPSEMFNTFLIDS